MKLKREEIQRLSQTLFQHLRDKHLITVLESDAKILEKINTVIQNNMDEELAIENQARKLIDQYSGQIDSGAIDPQKAFTMIKKQVAKERKFIL